MITKQEFVEHQRAKLHHMRPRMDIGRPAVPRKAYRFADLNSVVSTVKMRHTTYCLGVGQIKVSYGLGSTDSEHDSSKQVQYAIGGSWEFHPAPWLSHKSIITDAILLMRCELELIQPTIKHTLKTTIVLSNSHPVWGCIQQSDFQGFQRLLTTGAIRPDDTNARGETLLHYVCIRRTCTLLLLCVAICNNLSTGRCVRK